MHLIILTPEEKVYDGEVDLVRVPGSAEKGSFEILKNHAPIISSLQAGKVHLMSANGEKMFVIQSGFIEAKDDEINLLVEGVSEDLD